MTLFEYFKSSVDKSSGPVALWFFIVLIAELIIAVSIVSKIVDIDKKILVTNKNVTLSKINIITTIRDFRVILDDISEVFAGIFEYLERKRREYFYSTIKALSMMLLMFILKGKYKKMLLAYELISIGRETFMEIQKDL